MSTGGGHHSLVTGLTASAMSGLSSAFAGVYFEKCACLPHQM